MPPRHLPAARARAAAIRRLAPLTAADQRLIDALMASVNGLQEMARGWLRHEPDADNRRITAFDAACAAAGGSLAGVNLTRVLVGPDQVAGTALLALLIERTALGRPLMVSRRGVMEPFTFEQGDQAAEHLHSLQWDDLAERFEKVDKDPKTAAELVGMHLAREGRDDPFAFPAWSDEVMVECLVAAALTSAVMAMLRAKAKPVPSFGPYIDGLIHVVQAAYTVLSSDDGDFSAGFDSASQVIEECLLKSDSLDDLDVHDVHRLSAKLAGAFLLGVVGDPLDFDGETAAQAQLLLTYAHTVGMSIDVGSDGSDHFSDPFGPPESPRRPPLLN